MESLKFLGRPPIKLAESVKNVVHLNDPTAEAIMHRAVKIDKDFVESVLNQSLFGWEGRNPAPALDEDGNFQCTDLDLLSFMVPMATRGAVVEIPHYRNRRKVVVRESERKVGTNQFGRVERLVSHRDVFSFSVLIWDNTIVKTNPESGEETTGAWRSYMLVDCDGTWYDGWDCVTWKPTAKENKFLTEKSLWTGNRVYFKHYVHPNRWQSVFGAPYLLLKMLSLRLTDEAAFYRAEVERLLKLGLRLPTSEKKPYEPPEYEGKTESTKIKTAEFVLDVSDFTGAYTPVENSNHGLLEAHRMQKFLTYSLKPKVQFVLRSDEAAYFRYGEGRVASWMGDRTWRSGWKPPRGKVEWNQVVLSNDMALRFREKTVTQQVSAE